MSSSNSKRLQVADLDFREIRANLQEYLESQDTLKDYDFNGSALSTLLDVLSYATHYNAVNANLGINETFLDTAQFRGSVVGHARQLGYTPRSASASSAVINVTVNSPSSQSLTLERGHRFKARIDNVDYTFVTDTEYSTDNAVFEDVQILQGRFRTVEQIYDVESNEKILIPSQNADTSAITVSVYDTASSSTFETFTAAKELTSITGDSNIYFLAENPDGLFEVTFGDGIIGRQLENGNRVVVEYLDTDKAVPNGASIFTSAESVEGNSNLTISTVQSATGGAGKESVDSIRYNAPLTFAAQNRAVTPQDFEAIILENFANVASVKAWGGEDNDPPEYGKVFISVKPQTSEVLSTLERAQILEDIIGPKSIVTITPEIIDPQFTYIGLEIFFKYDSTLTGLTQTQLQTAVRSVINNYNTTYLNQFNRVFRHSQVLSVIDDTSEAILNSTARVYVKKRFIPSLISPNQYTLNFSGPLYQSSSRESVITASTLFTVNGLQCRFKDKLNSDGSRTVQIVTGEDVNEIVVIADAGRIEGSKIILTNFAPTNFQGSYIEVEALPDSNDIAPTLNNILVIDSADLSVIGEVDTIVAGQDFSGINYSTTPRHA